MTDKTSAESDKTKALPKKPRAIFPWVIVFVVIVLFLVINLFDEWLAEAINLDPGVKNLSRVGLPLVMMLLVGGWYLIRRARSINVRSMIALAGVLGPILFFVLFQPVFGGNANLERFEPRFWGQGTKIVEKAAESSKSPLATTTDYDFPQFLGANRNGKVENVSLANWSEAQPELLWKQPVGEAWSGFAVVNGFAITQEQREEIECVVCYEIETGNTVWNYSVERRHEDFRGFGRVGPRATPTIHNGKVYAVSGTGIIDCLNGEDGKLIWSFDLPAAVGIEQVVQKNSRGIEFEQESSSMIWGRSSSPLIVNDMLVIPAGGMIEAETDSDAAVDGRRVAEPGATLIALDLETGEEVWRGGNRMVAYGSPSRVTIAGVQQVVLIAEDHAVGHDPATGKELWAFPWQGDSSAAANCSQVTTIDDQTILLSKGYSTGAQVLSFKPEDAITPIEGAKDPRALKTKFSNPVIFEGNAYSITDRFLECVDAKTLKTKWRRRGFGTGQLLLIGNKLLVHAETGKLALVEATPGEYRELGSIKTIEGTCWNTLAIYNDLVLVRSDKQAACYRLPLTNE